MQGPLVTLGVPVYRGHDLLPTTLECLRTQSYRNLDVLISVDGPDDATVASAQPFLEDPRFRLHVQPKNLGWAGNTDWTIRNRRGAFYVYQQHDDQISPTYIADLVAAAERWPNASICFTKMEISGVQNRIARGASLTGEPIRRALTYLERLEAIMLRGLIRGTAIERTDGLLMNEFKGYGSENRFLLQLALAGEFRFVPGPTYYKRMHGENLHLKWYHWPQELKRGAWIALGAWIAEALVPAGQTTEQRWQLLETALERFLIARGWFSGMRNRGRDLYRYDASESGRRLLAAIDRLRSSAPAVDAWLRGRIRFMFCEIDNNDLVARAEMLQAILARLRDGGRFDVQELLQSDWRTVDAAMAMRFAVAIPAGSTSAQESGQSHDPS